MNAGVALTFLAIGLLAGCTSAPDDAAPPADLTEDVFADRQKFTISGCTGLLYNAPWFGPAPEGQAPAPEGWGTLVGQAYYDIMGELHQCERIAWGGLERGPVWFGWEDHEAYVAPEACTRDIEGFVYHRTAHHVLSDDPDVVAHARSLNLPAHLVDAEVREGTLSSGHVLSWGTNGNPRSSVEVQTADEERGGLSLAIALFWSDGDGRLYRLAMERSSTASTTEAGTATFHAPSLLAERPSPQPVQPTWLTETQWVGEVVVFDGPDCLHRVDA